MANNETRQNVTISTLNLHGLTTSKAFLQSQFEQNPNAIWAIQEHWLRPSVKQSKGVNQLQTVHSNFDGWGTSAMEAVSTTQITRGRPYGGTGFLWNKKYASAVKPLVNFKHDRVTVLQLDTADGPILCISAYMPYFSGKDVEADVNMYRDVCGFIEMMTYITEFNDRFHNCVRYEL